QAEDGIRDFHVTGVQTCALPILEALVQQLSACGLWTNAPEQSNDASFSASQLEQLKSLLATAAGSMPSNDESSEVTADAGLSTRSEERRGGKECRRERTRDEYRG